MTDRLFEVEPIEGEKWGVPGSEPWTICRVWMHPIHGCTWVKAERGNYEGTSEGLAMFLRRGFKRVA